jgi:hypothetical protein
LTTKAVLGIEYTQAEEQGSEEWGAYPKGSCQHSQE